MTPHREHPGPRTADASPFDRRGTSRPVDDEEGVTHRVRPRSAKWAALYASRVARALTAVVVVSTMVLTALSSLGFLSSTPSSRISALTTVVAGNTKDIGTNSHRIDSLGRSVGTRFDSLDDRLTFMNYLLCTQSAAHLTSDARTKCDTIIQRRLNP